MFVCDSQIRIASRTTLLLIITSISATSFLDFVSVWWIQWKLCIKRPFMSKWAHVWIGAWMRYIVGKVNGARVFFYSCIMGVNRERKIGRKREGTDTVFYPSFLYATLKPTYHFGSHKSVKLTVTPATTQHALWMCFQYNDRISHCSRPFYAILACLTSACITLKEQLITVTTRQTREVRALKLPSYAKLGFF